ncbi:Polynucleotide adenylyltransferase region [Gloeocapsa sp. PCC 7428]|uniref:CBS domain-containing protein n=1 Tax=Gloeocapsa sp. PCC 7428 TaxID=1173026 RepID=UPI0002A60A4D|nr:CBS domain-containing protein [Gloeocapsa sp. PCC 7428]AFZ28658.1 Polynucleotide adenylyltransferase region [Gloeocapsa sp. PCC 7428]
MDLILCHTTADFDALGAAVGVARLLPGAKIVLTGGSHPAVRDFLALHRDEYPLIERRAVHPEQIRSLVVVDTQKRDRLGKAAEWLNLPQLEAIRVYDHHVDVATDIPATQIQIAPVGAATTLVVEELQQHNISVNSIEATVMALGIHVDTGSLTFAQATARDAIALSWLMNQGANLRVIRDYIDPGLSPELQELLTTALADLQTEVISGYNIAWVLLETTGYVMGLSSLASQLMEITESDALILAAQHIDDERLTIIGRSRIPGTNLNEVFQEFGGGGHSQAASISLRSVDVKQTLTAILNKLKKQTPQPPIARDLMSSPVRTIRPETTIGEAQRILLRYGHSGLCVADSDGQLVGIVSRRDLDIALHHGFSHAPVKGYMKTNLKTILPTTTLPEIESLMVTYDIGRLPVLDNSELVGIVTRTDVLREIHQEETSREQTARDSILPNYRQGAYQLLRDRLAPQLWELLIKAATHASQRGWHLYLVGGAVRDLLLTYFRHDKYGSDKSTFNHNSSLLTDIDLVVDGPVANNGIGAGVQLAQELQQIYPNVRLEVHGAFQTAALLWHKDPVFDSLWVDIATARTEFYPYPAANPEVEASSIRQDLYRRDFTINALAIRLTSPRAGELLDFFGGFLDLQAKQIRVLHANSFIEDPTRIYRAVRFAVRLDFTIEPETESYIRYCIASGIYNRVQGDTPALSTRLKGELKYILEAPYWKRALKLLSDLGALKCIHPTLEPDRELWRQLRLLERCLQQKLDWQQNLHHWLLRLEAIVAHISPEYRAQVATNLQLPDDSIKRLASLSEAQTKIEELLLSYQQPSQVVQLLRRYDTPTLILIAIRTNRRVRRLIWQYFNSWRLIEPPLNGNDLKALGYKPGPLYRIILDELLAATLDGKINHSTNSEELRKWAIAFVKNRYPQQKIS